MRIAKRDGASANQFIAVAVAEKTGAVHAEDFFVKFSESANIEKARAILRRARITRCRQNPWSGWQKDNGDDGPLCP